MKYLKAVKEVVATLFLLALSFCAGYFVGELPDQEPEAVIEEVGEAFDLTLPGEIEKTVVTVDEVEAKILEIGELTTCEGEYHITKGRDFTRYMLDDIPVPGTTNHIELSCTGVVKAGYTLEDISVRVDNVSMTIYVSLPEPEVHSNQIIWDDNMFIEENNILNPIDFGQYQEIISEIKEEGLEEVMSDGFYERVGENARKLISNFLSCFSDYTIEYI